MRACILTLALLLTSIPALAQEAPESVEEIARTMIARAGAADVFVVATDQNMAQFPRIRHVPSGLICVFSPRFEGEVVIYENSPTLARGDDVGCNAQSMFDTQSLYATRVSPGLTLAQDFEITLLAIRQRYAEAQPYLAPPSPAALPVRAIDDIERMRASFIVGDIFTHVSLAHVDGWAVKLRLTGPAATAQILDNRADMAFWQAVRAMIRTRAEIAPAPSDAN